MNKKKVISGFSKLSKIEKLLMVSKNHSDSDELIKDFQDYWHQDENTQKLFDEFSENTISNFFIPFGVAPNFIIDNKNYIVPMVIEESSVIAAAANAAKWWATRGGFHTEVISTKKVGQVHFLWKGDFKKLKAAFPELKKKLFEGAKQTTGRMEKRGGGIIDIQLLDYRSKIDNYYQLKAEFETVDSMGANFINSCLEDFAVVLRQFFIESFMFEAEEKDCKIIMSILSNYTPDCLVRSWVECDISEFNYIDEELSAEEFVLKFDSAIKIAKVDSHRATTHNKGVFNGIDAVALATGNDFRAIEACGHAYASRNGSYSSLTDVKITDGKFKYSLTIPLALGTVGGLTSLHPLAKRSLQLLNNPSAHELMRVAASVGLANNFSAIKSLITKGIQKGHMKMHLMNILNNLKASNKQKELAVGHFKNHKVSFTSVGDFINTHPDNRQ